MPFEDGDFDCVVCNDSLHHWEEPVPVIDEIARVGRDSGHCIIHDLKRLQTCPPRLAAWGIGMMIPRDMRRHYWNSIKSAYTPDELCSILERSQLRGWRIKEDFMDLIVVKEGVQCPG